MGKRRANGEGSIYKRSDGRWCATVSVDGGRRKSFYGRRREDVALRLATALKARQDGLPVVGEQETLEHYLTKWLEGVGPSLRYKTSERYGQVVRLHVLRILGRIRLGRLGPEHLQRLYAQCLKAGLAPGTVRQIHAVIHHALRDALRWGMVARNVATLVSPPRQQRREIQALSAEQVRLLLEAAQGDPLEALYVLAVTTGMRRGEVMALRWQDVDLERATVQVRGSLQPTRDGPRIVEPKTAQSRRQVALTQRAVDAIRQHRVRQAEERLRAGPGWEDHDLVFPCGTGRPLNPTSLRRSFMPLVRRAGLPPIRFHDLRHTAATLMLVQGVHPKVASEMLGHSNIAMTLDLYSHVTPTMQRQAAEALDAVLRV